MITNDVVNFEQPGSGCRLFQHEFETIANSLLVPNSINTTGGLVTFEELIPFQKGVIKAYGPSDCVG